jgi:hypothetical protein
VHGADPGDQCDQSFEELGATGHLDPHHLGDLAEQDVGGQAADESDQDWFGQEVGEEAEAKHRTQHE